MIFNNRLFVFRSDWQLLYLGAVLLSMIVAVFVGSILARMQFEIHNRENIQLENELKEVEAMLPQLARSIHNFNLGEIANLGQTVLVRSKFSGYQIIGDNGFIFAENLSNVEKDNDRHLQFNLVIPEDRTLEEPTNYGYFSIWIRPIAEIRYFSDIAVPALLTFAGLTLFLLTGLTWTMRIFVERPLEQMLRSFELRVKVGYANVAPVPKGEFMRRFVEQFNIGQTKLQGAYEEIQKKERSKSEQAAILELILKNTLQSARHYNPHGQIIGDYVQDDFRPIFLDVLPEQPILNGQDYVDWLGSNTNDISELHLNQIPTKNYFIVEFCLNRKINLRVECISLSNFGVSITVSDITLTKQIELERQKSSKLASLGTMIAGITHDFNNVFAVINSSLELLELQTESKNQELIDNARTALNRGASSMSSILNFSRTKSKHYKTFNVREAVDEMIKMARVASSKSISFKLIIEENYMVNGDRTDFENAVLNLLLNAQDAIGDEGEINVLIGPLTNGLPNNSTLENENLNQYFSIIIEDTGPGIPPEVMDRIFDPFFTTKFNKAGAGTGLGLANVFSTCQRFDGFVKCWNRQQGGAAFQLILPFAIDFAAPNRIELHSNHSNKNTRNTALSVLIVEDEPALGLAMQKYLNYYNFECQLVKSVAEFEVEVKKYKKCDIILTDLQLKDGSGFTVCEITKQILPDACLVLMSGNLADIWDAREFDLKIEKPFSLSDLRDQLIRCRQKKSNTTATTY